MSGCDPTFIYLLRNTWLGHQMHHRHDQSNAVLFCQLSTVCPVGNGVYYKGTVTDVQQQMPAGGINLQGRQDYDPWEALEVEWDVGGDAEGMDRVSPWEIEVCLPGLIRLHLALLLSVTNRFAVRQRSWQWRSSIHKRHATVMQ